MEVQHDEAVEHLLRLEDLDRLEHLGRRQAELGGLASGLRPLARAARVELRAHADQGPHSARPRDVEDAVELRDLLEDEHDLLLHPHGIQGHPDEGLVLVAVAGDDALGRQIGRDRGEQLRLRARLEAVAVAPSGLHDVVDDDALLVDLDRENAPEDVPISVLVDRPGEGVVQVGDGRRENLREPDDHRRRDAAQRDLVDDVLERDRPRPLRASGGRRDRPSSETWKNPLPQFGIP